MNRSETTRLLRQARDGHTDAVNRLYDRLGGRLLALVRLRMGDHLRQRIEPEDVVQEVLLDSFRRIEDFEQDNSRSFFAWLATIANHRISDLATFHRRAKRDMDITVAEPSQPLPAQLRSALSHMIVDQKMADLERALASLPEKHREMIILRRLEERPFSEIAQLTNCREDAARMLFNRALAKLTLAMAAQKKEGPS